MRRRSSSSSPRSTAIHAPRKSTSGAFCAASSSISFNVTVSSPTTPTQSTWATASNDMIAFFCTTPDTLAGALTFMRMRKRRRPALVRSAGRMTPKPASASAAASAPRKAHAPAASSSRRSGRRLASDARSAG